MDHNQYSTEDPELEFQPDLLEIHPLFDPKTIKNDLCMIHTSAKIPVFSESLTLPPKTACLPELDSEEELGRECFIAGWGLKNQQGDRPYNLQETGVPLLDHQTCDDWYK
ncbi:Oidioi.mRNA.OKI2018_I69.PAR.g8985.t1.cds [Oikopleura dioica]|uniref:Oidioi.mRNA.OKI2018_I69.PAR.g8985.t1.cds n=1 Tax=Oikopleura dioica TaxID=34765 RepID=A0ABN7RII8_OIKDI|nr:Oidioi.mRNA.OKI2018_I69.PAR.g8985.t1.cds [Oikopleura dioica]